jgi:hypothetical protein
MAATASTKGSVFIAWTCPTILCDHDEPAMDYEAVFLKTETQLRELESL